MRFISASAFNLQKPLDDSELDVEATEKDLIFEIGNIFFMVQRENDWNNVVCFRVARSSMTLKEVVKVFRRVMISQNIQYIRVEGTKRRYLFLLKMLPELFGDEVGIIKSNETDERNIFYIKCW